MTTPINNHPFDPVHVPQSAFDAIGDNVRKALSPGSVPRVPVSKKREGAGL